MFVVVIMGSWHIFWSKNGVSTKSSKQISSRLPRKIIGKSQKTVMDIIQY